MSKRAAIVLLIISFAFVGYVIYGSVARVESECEVCVEFRARLDCRTAAGATESEAQQAAQTTACGLLARGMDQSIACQRAVPRSVRCTSR